MSSASSTARCMECTVDSMLTTTPFLRPRDRLEPSPMISISPSGEISPTMATTFDVPMSRPTIRFLSVFRAMPAPFSDGIFRGALLPAHGKTVGVAHVHGFDAMQLAGEARAEEGREPLEAADDVAPAGHHARAAVQHQRPRAAVAELERDGAEPVTAELLLHQAPALQHQPLSALGSREHREARGPR